MARGLAGLGPSVGVCATVEGVMEAVSFAGRPGERGMTMEQKRKSVLRAAGTVLLVGCALVAWGATIRRDMSEERSKAAFSSLLQRAALDSSGGSNSSSTPSSGTDFSKMMEEYDQASDEELKKAGLSRGSSNPSDCTLTSSKGCMEENDRSFNALRFMIWKRQHDPAERSDTDQWANKAGEEDAMLPDRDIPSRTPTDMIFRSKTNLLQLPSSFLPSWNLSSSPVSRFHPLLLFNLPTLHSTLTLTSIILTLTLSPVLAVGSGNSGEDCRARLEQGQQGKV